MKKRFKTWRFLTFSVVATIAGLSAFIVARLCGFPAWTPALSLEMDAAGWAAAFSCPIFLAGLFLS